LQFTQWKNKITVESFSSSIVIISSFNQKEINNDIIITFPNILDLATYQFTRYSGDLNP
jgi:hypothetical protein